VAVTRIVFNDVDSEKYLVRFVRLHLHGHSRFR